MYPEHTLLNIGAKSISNKSCRERWKTYCVHHTFSISITVFETVNNFYGMCKFHNLCIQQPAHSEIAGEADATVIITEVWNWEESKRSVTEFTLRWNHICFALSM